jgi:hypothetical protein
LREALTIAINLLVAENLTNTASKLEITLKQTE